MLQKRAGKKDDGDDFRMKKPQGYIFGEKMGLKF